MIDLTTYALLRKQITTAASGVSDVRAEGDELVFVLADGHEVRVAIPATEIRDAVVRDDVLVLTLEDDKEIIVDATLTQSGQAADAKVTGDALALKLTEPSTGLAVGKYFRIAAIDESGHAVLEAVDLPSAPVQDVQVNGVSVVADGVANVGIDKPYELIEEITMEEEAKIIRENEPNGTNYNFKSFLIIGETPVISVKKYIVILINAKWAVSFTLDLNSKRYFAAKIYVEGGRMFSSSTYGASSDAISSMHTRNRNSFGLYAMNTINKFETSENHFPIGTKIKLYGVRA